MLSDDRFHRWQIEHLTGELANDGRVIETHPTPRAPARVWPTTMSGSTTAARFLPAAPGCLPALLPERPHRNFGAGFASPSDDGGLDEFFEFIPRLAFSARISPVSLSIASVCALITAPCSTTLARNSPVARHVD